MGTCLTTSYKIKLFKRPAKQRREIVRKTKKNAVSCSLDTDEQIDCETNRDSIISEEKGADRCGCSNSYQEIDCEKNRDSIISEEKRAERCGSPNSCQHPLNEHQEELQDNLRSRVLSVEQDFIKFLKPSDIIFDIQGIDDRIVELILETEKTSREQAVKDLLTNILEDSDLLTKFIFALGAKGYRRFIDPISGTYPKKGIMFCQDYFGFIMNFLKGELIDVLDTLPICRYLYATECLELSDMEQIEAVHSTKGRTAACQELFLIVRRRKANWALLMVEAIRTTQEYVKVKMDPSSTQEDLERTGVRLPDNSRCEASMDLTRKTGLKNETLVFPFDDVPFQWKDINTINTPRWREYRINEENIYMRINKD